MAKKKEEMEKEKLIVLERNLFFTKWFDYRGLTPDDATKHFVNCFDEVFFRMYQKTKYKYYKVFKKGDYNRPLNQWKHYKIFTKLRQIADAHCCKYQDFVNFLFDGFIELGYNRLYPSVFLSGKLVKHALTKEKEKYSSGIKLSNYINAENYNPNSIIHNEYFNYLLYEISKKSKVIRCQLLKQLATNKHIPEKFLTTNYSD